MSELPEINPARSKNFWEPVFEPGEATAYEKCPDLQRITGIKEVRIDLSEQNQVDVLSGMQFNHVDFVGVFDGGTIKATFKSCEFIMCSFRGCKISNAKFTNCRFIRTTFSESEFTNCEFRNCSYSKIWISGNTTALENIYVDPSKLLKHFYLAKDKNLLSEHKTNYSHQSYMLQKTKSVIARKLSSMGPIKSDIDMFIVSIKTARKYEITSKIMESYYFLLHGSIIRRLRMLPNLLFYSLEFIVVFSVGWLSGWGQKIGKAVSFGLLVILLYGFAYSSLYFTEESFGQSLLRSFEYMLLFGYTKYPFHDLDLKTQWVIFSNTALGMVWFSALIPAVLNKLGQQDEQ